MEIVVLLGILLGFLVFGGFTLYLFYLVFKSIVSNKVNGKKVICKVKEVKKVDRKNGTDAHIEALCEFECDGVHHENTLKILNESETTALKIGNTLECTYNTKTDDLVPLISLPGPKDSKDFWFKMTCIFAISLVIFSIFFKFGGKLSETIIMALAFLFWYSAALLFYDGYSIKNKKDFIKLTGKVIDYQRYAVNQNNSNNVWEQYAPILSFKYNNQKLKLTSNRISNKKYYKTGQEVNIYYNPVNQEVYEKAKNGMMTFYLIVPIIILIIMILKTIYKF